MGLILISRRNFLVTALLARSLDAVSGERLYSDDFRGGLDKWIVEQQPGGTVTTRSGRLVIDDLSGCTVWFRRELFAPVSISYIATVAEKPRVSDLNCFFMATDPARPGNLLVPGHRRDGKFENYDFLSTYYVGYGGNDNTTTRFRRYAGDGTRPLLPGHDLNAPAVLLRSNHAYRIMIIVMDGRVQFIRDGGTVFDYRDPAPLLRGWFGFRTVRSRIELRDFVVTRPDGEKTVKGHFA